MPTGALTEYIDVAQVTLYVFWIFFAGLIYYLHRENKREGYPLESDRTNARVKVQGWPPVPAPKTYKLQHGGVSVAPHDRDRPQTLAARPAGAWPGAPLVPTGNPMLDGVGPGSYTQRADRPDLTFEGTNRIVPLRTDPAFDVASQDPDPRGMPVLGADGEVGGTVVDLWVDRSEMLFRYLELEVTAPGGKRRVLLPMNFARVDHVRGWGHFLLGRTKVHGKGAVRVQSILGRQFAAVPGTAQPEQVTLLEEERIMAYYGAGTLYATPQRQEPLL
jgi:photosynthetic reaction center H subunit